MFVFLLPQVFDRVVKKNNPRILCFLFIKANTHMCLISDICIGFNSVPLSLDLTVQDPRP